MTSRFFFNGRYKDPESNGYAGQFRHTAGMISLDAKYVDPFGLGCDIDKVDPSRPGVYEIATKKRVVFKSRPKISVEMNKEEIDKKCLRLLKSTATLKALGGYLSQ
ncbi:hypothetical protein D3C79_912400 [compost metagenome]